MSSYVELHCHSAFSFLDGASLPDELVLGALEQGHQAMALTDHDTLSGSMEFAQAAGAHGLHAIHGAEVSIRPDGVRPEAADPAALRHLTLLVRSAAGWRSLCRLLTRAHAHTRETPSRRRDQLAPSVTIADVAEHAEGLVCLSGCARRGVRDDATLRRLRDAFGGGPDGLRIELQRPFARHDRARNRELVALARRLELRAVATGNVHAHARTRAPLQDAFVAVREHTTLDASEPLRRGNHAHVLATPAAMASRFADHPDAVAEAARLAESLTFDLGHDLGYRYPGSEDADADSKLAAICHGLFDSRYPGPTGMRADAGSRPAGSAAAAQSLRERAAARLEQELKLIEQLGLSGFFILHHELLELAREVAAEVRGADTVRSLLPPGRGRGSSVSSIVCYLTGLSHVDPVANELFLGRFLNAEITSLPDIDLDFPRDVRATLIPRIHEVYGRDRSALVAAFPTYRSRGAVREIGKALGLPPGEIERVARASEGWGASKVGEDVVAALGEGRLEVADGQAGRWDWLVRLAKEAQGLPRHLSQHSGGMIVATRPLVDCCPVVPAAMEGRQMVMWDKDSCADAGFLKIDLLGLGMLSAVERCVELIAATSGERVDLSRIPYDDKPTYTAIQRAETTGVFQIESRAQMASLLRTHPENLDDLTIQVAIVRPGPIQGGAVNPYIDRRQRIRADPNYKIPYEHPALERVLKDTLGTIIFQDQVIEVAMDFAGFSAGEAEGLRRAMSRKRSQAAMHAYKDRFLQGAQQVHGVTPAVAERVYAMIVGFSGFGFPKAHGAAFGLLAYQSTWLRVHHGPELLCALLDEQPMGFYPPDALVHEAQRRGITILPADVNASEVGCTLEPAPAGSDFASAVRIGLGYVLGVREDEVRTIASARSAGGPFTSVQDLISRAGAGRPALERLAWSGTCDALVADEVAIPGHRRRAALWRLGAAAPGIRLQRRSRGGPTEDLGTQLALPLAPPSAPGLPALGDWDAMIADYASTGVTTATHPVELLRAELDGQRALASTRLRTARHGSTIRAGGLVVARQRPGTAKGIVFMLLEDEGGTINLIVPPDIYERYRLLVRTEPLIVAEGRLERHPAAGGQVNVLVRRLWALEAPDRPLAVVKDFSPLDLQELEREQQAEGQQAAAAAGGGGDFRAVAPPIMNFGAGRRR
ncbi:DNA polymerase III subunit alpha [Paraconexibacter sp. AEG42_29]|uniref:DNA polymerase III subunit alpha n=1 Tax=Paraconexibacter sp. AEG42_29 TaxID=2997339 RepID=UPI00339D4BE0